MKVTACCLILSFFVLLACNGHKPIAKTKIKRKPTICFDLTPAVCDTCTTVILVTHNDGTGSGEITVDSGIVYIPREIFKKALSLRVDTTADTTILRNNWIDQEELYFEEGKHYFRQLWKDTINFKDEKAAFRLHGKIIDVKRIVRSNGVEEYYPSLFFRLERVEPVNDKYFKKVMKKLSLQHQ